MGIKDILKKLGIASMNEMQTASYDAILHTNGDVVILSPTGSGKTYAYLFPLIELLDSNSDSLQAVIIVPGRELALQSVNVFNNIGSGLRACACYGGRATMDEHRVLRKVKPHVIFATPGRLNDHIDKGNISPEEVKYLVIDEFDKCLEMGFMDEMSRLLSSLYNVERHLLLSATDADSIPRFVNMGKTKRIDFLVSESQVSSEVSLYSVRSATKDKLETLEKLLRMRGAESSIVFLNYRDSVERTNDFLCSKGFVTSSFHGGMEQKDREDALYKFTNGSANIFVSTDLASRGLDIPSIDNIIHYHLPESEDGYIHRVGRTARWDAKGRSFFILGPEESLPEYIEGDVKDYVLSDDLPKPSMPRMTTLYIGKGKKEKISKGDIVGFLCKQGKLDSNDIGQIDVKERYSYVAISREKLGYVLKNVEGEKIKGIKTIVESVK